MASTAAKESWKEMENRAGGKKARITRAAMARVFRTSCVRPRIRAAKKTPTMISARWVEGDMPASRP